VYSGSNFPKLSRNVQPLPPMEKMKALFFFEIFVNLYQTARCYIPEDNFQSHRCQLHIMLSLDMRKKWQNEPGGLVDAWNKLWSGGDQGNTGLISPVPDICS